jgi:hypothetical protein
VLRTAGVPEVVVMDAGRIDAGRARREAKALLARARAGDAGALARLRAHPAARLAGVLGDDALLAERAQLSDAQLAVARELGRASWPALVREAEPDRRFVLAATSGRRDHAERLHPAAASVALDVALVLGDVDAVRAALEGDASAATTPGGARGWLPLQYACHSVFVPGRREAFLALARLLCSTPAPRSTTRCSTSPRRASRRGCASDATAAP